MKTIIFILSLSLLSWAGVMQPSYEYRTSGLVTDLLLEGDTLYAATDRGVVESFNIRTHQAGASVTLPKVADFMGDLSFAKIYSIDMLGDAMIIVSQGKSGYRDLYKYRSGTLTQLIDATKELIIKEGLFVDEGRIVLGLLSSEIILYDIVKKEMIYRKPIKARTSGGSALGDITLDESRRILITADESGEVNLFNVNDFTFLKRYSGQNLDNIYKIDYKNNTMITAGQDRRCAIYRTSGEAYYVNGSFLIYAAALSPSANLGVFAATIDNELQLFDTRTKQTLAKLKGHDATLNDILFEDESHLFSAAEEKRILYWNLTTQGKKP
jgi:WD40 repeat protein